MKLYVTDAAVRAINSWLSKKLHVIQFPLPVVIVVKGDKLMYDDDKLDDAQDADGEELAFKANEDVAANDAVSA